MGKKIALIVLIIILLIASNYGMYYYMNQQKIKETDKLHNQISVIEDKLKALGDVKLVYSTPRGVAAGEEINIKALELREVPSTMFSMEYITEEKVLKHTLAKVDIAPGSPILRSMLMPELVYDGDRYVDIVADVFPVHLRKNQFIDYEITTPKGESYIVFSKKRVIEVEPNSIQAMLTQEDKARYNSALVDAFLNPGTVLSAVVYPEPGLQSASINYYPVPDNIVTNMKLNPNILNIAREDLIKKKRMVFNNALNLEEIEQEFISQGRSVVFSKLVADLQTVRAKYEEEEERRKEEEGSAPEPEDEYVEAVPYEEPEEEEVAE